MAVIGPRFTLKGFDPPGLRSTPLAQQRAFWAAVSQYVAEAKEAELRAGLDRFGEPMAGLSARTIRDRRSEMGRADPHAPPLQPAHGLSRTRALFVAQPTARLDGVTCYWSLDRHTGASWGEILRFHRAGNRHLPVRDVIGLSPLSLATVKQRAAAWWAVYNDLTASMIGRKPVESGPAPAFTYSRVPPYRPKSPEAAVPGRKQRVSSLDVNGKHYTFQSGSAAQVKDAIGTGKFSGFHSHAEVKAAAARLGTTHDAKGRAIFSFGSKGPPIPKEPRPAPKPKPAPRPAPKPAPAPEPPRPGSFETHEHVTQWAGRTFPNATADVAEIPVPVWNHLAKELDHLARQYPEVAGNLRGLTTKNAAWTEDIPAGPFGRSPDTLAIAKDTTHLSINPKHHQDIRWVTLANERAEGQGWIAKGTGNGVSTMTHEWGHLIDNWVLQDGRSVGFRDEDTDWFEIRRPFLKDAAGGNMDISAEKAVSICARTNSNEAVAEGFAAARWTPEAEKSGALRLFESALKKAVEWIRGQST